MIAIETKHGESGMSQWAQGLLPTPHLLDAAWWFDRVTVESFRLEVGALSKKAMVAFLGTPSLFLDAWERGEERTCVLVDRDDAIRERISKSLVMNVEVIDLLAQTPRVRGADLVIADPPWYVNDTMAFLAAGQGISRVGAEVQICLPPKATRPTVEQERSDIFQWAAAGGLRLKRLIEGRVSYGTPPFELNVLRSTQQSQQGQLRVGDLAIFEVERGQGLVIPSQLEAHEWSDHTILDVRWRVRAGDGAGNGNPELISLGFRDDVFPSCSKRHADRPKPDVWTSGNRAFVCGNPQRFLAILRSLNGKSIEELKDCAARLYPVTESVEARVADQILVLLQVEQREIEAYKRCPSGNETL